MPWQPPSRKSKDSQYHLSERPLITLKWYAFSSCTSMKFAERGCSGSFRTFFEVNPASVAGLDSHLAILLRARKGRVMKLGCESSHPTIDKGIGRWISSANVENREAESHTDVLSEAAGYLTGVSFPVYSPPKFPLRKAQGPN